MIADSFEHFGHFGHPYGSYGISDWEKQILGQAKDLIAVHGDFLLPQCITRGCPQVMTGVMAYQAMSWDSPWFDRAKHGIFRWVFDQPASPGTKKSPQILIRSTLYKEDVPLDLWIS